MPSSESALTAADALRSLNNEKLTALLMARVLRASSIADFFDLADALLEPDSVQAALAHLTRAQLASLAVIAEHGTIDADRLSAVLAERGAVFEADVSTPLTLALVIAKDSLLIGLDPVAERLAAWPTEGLPSAQQLVRDAPPTAIGAVETADQGRLDALAAEASFATLTALTHMLDAIDHEPVRELSKGGIGLPDTRRLAEASGVPFDDVAILLDLATLARLISLGDGHWTTTEAVAEWMSSPADERWRRLAAAWLTELPSDLRNIITRVPHTSWDHRLGDYADWWYPAGGTWLSERIATGTARSRALGVTYDHVPSTAGSLLFEGDADAAASAMASHFPAAVEQLYLLPDLTAVAPGPLQSPADQRMRMLADVEVGGLASRYRITAESLTRALSSGETRESLSEFLASVSLTGVPQPLTYLLTETAAKYGSIRVGPHERGSILRVAEPALLRQLEVDRSLEVLRLTNSGDQTMLSRQSPETVFWMLVDARYAVVIENAAGAVQRPPKRRRAARATPAPSTALADLVTRLRASVSPSDGEGTAWLARQLEVAARSRTAVIVTVKMPNGSTTDFTLEPTAIAHGRLRARDARADLERTLPLTSIVAVTPA